LSADGAAASPMTSAGSLPRVTGEPQPAQPQSFYDAVGGEPTFRCIAARFYELVAADEILRALYPEADLGPAEERLRLFLIQQWGGPAMYSRLRGPTGLGTRHREFRIARPHRDAWLRAMGVALDDAGLAPAHRERLWNQLETMAWNFTTHASPRT
jgi:hemoglobin